MALFSFLILTSLCIAGREALNLSDCGAYARRPGETAVTFVFTLLFCVKEVILILVQMQTFREAISILVYVRYLINTLKRVLITLLDMCKHRRQSC